MSRIRKLHRLELFLLLLAGATGMVCLVLSAPAGELLARAVHGWMWLGAQFSIVNSSTPLVRVLLPAVVCGALVYGVMLINPRPARVTRAAVIVLLVALYTAYMAFRLFATFNLSTITAAVFSVLFFPRGGPHLPQVALGKFPDVLADQPFARRDEALRVGHRRSLPA